MLFDPLSKVQDQITLYEIFLVDIDILLHLSLFPFVWLHVYLNKVSVSYSIFYYKTVKTWANLVIAMINI